MTARDEMDLPEPDSPTRPRTSPAEIEKVRSRTASEDCADVGGLASPLEEARLFDLARNSMLSRLRVSKGSTRLW